jgi:hypothetical protein
LPHDAPAIAVAAQERGKFGLLIGGGVIVAAVALTIFLVVRSNNVGDERVAIQGGEFDDIGMRPDDPRRGTVQPDKKGSNAVPDPIARPPRTWGNGGNGTGSTSTGSSGTNGTGKVESNGLPGALTALDPSEVETEVQKRNSLWTRCKDRSMKEDPFFDIKKVDVTMSIDKTGAVTEVSLSNDAAKNQKFIQCMTGGFKGVRFRASAKGIDTRIKVVFQ